MASVGELFNITTLGREERVIEAVVRLEQSRAEKKEHLQRHSQALARVSVVATHERDPLLHIRSAIQQAGVQVCPDPRG